jgi:anti-sigma28 factor (negative regulator of flagellin synthesis)
VDRIEISSEGRLLAAQFEATRPEAEELAPAQVEAIQQRIASGIYDSSEIVEAVARKIIERGDL